jgi:hypothetical protein
MLRKAMEDFEMKLAVIVIAIGVGIVILAALVVIELRG